jgi:predicted ATPase
MLNELSFENFTAFKKARFAFASDLNVIIGENGTGKTHILKAAYSSLYVSAKGSKEHGPVSPTKGYLQTAITDKLSAVFRPDELGRLAHRARRGRQRCEVTCRFSQNSDHGFFPAEGELAFSFNSTSKSEVVIEKTPSGWVEKLPVYLPTLELLTIYSGFVSLYETTHVSFEETWRDTCILLGAPLAKGRGKRIKELMIPLEAAMGGEVELDKAGRFYLNVDGVSMEMHLVAEGLRKLAMLARLIATGSLVDKGFLFWDEPESNLNPKVINLIARTILHLCQSGIQVFIASHSLFLLRELDILSQSEQFSDVKSRFFNLHHGNDGVDVQQGDTIDDIGAIDSLQEDLAQSDRYLDAGVV